MERQAFEEDLAALQFGLDDGHRLRGPTTTDWRGQLSIATTTRGSPRVAISSARLSRPEPTASSTYLAWADASSRTHHVHRPADQRKHSLIAAFHAAGGPERGPDFAHALPRDDVDASPSRCRHQIHRPVGRHHTYHGVVDPAQLLLGEGEIVGPGIVGRKEDPRKG